MRHIASEIFADEFFGTLAMEYRVLWVGLIASCADDQGRFMDNAALIRSIVFPYDEKITMKTIENGLAIFAKGHKIIRYVVGTNGSGKRLIQIINWWKYQHSTQWARQSLYTAPPKWNDRVRIHRPGNGNIPYTLNWDGVGGYAQPTKVLSTPKRPAYQDDRPRPRPRPMIKQPPPKPSSLEKGKKKLVGGGSNLQSKTAQAIHPIMRAAGLGEAKTMEFIAKVQDSIEPTKAVELTLAALASVHADPKVGNKPVVAAYRFENDQIPAQYFNKSTWTNLPAKILKAANFSPATTTNKKIVYVDGMAQEVATA